MTSFWVEIRSPRLPLLPRRKAATVLPNAAALRHSSPTHFLHLRWPKKQKKKKGEEKKGKKEKEKKERKGVPGGGGASHPCASPKARRFRWEWWRLSFRRTFITMVLPGFTFRRESKQERILGSSDQKSSKKVRWLEKGFFVAWEEDYFDPVMFVSHS